MTEPRLSDLQCAVMRVLWDQDEATVSDVHARLRPQRRLAVTTVATVLQRLEKRGLLSHRADGRQFVYRALVTEPEVRRSMVSELTDLLFSGDPAALVNHLLTARDFKASDLARVKALIESKERGRPRGNAR